MRDCGICSTAGSALTAGDGRGSTLDHPEGLRESFRAARSCHKTRRESRILCEMNRHKL